MGQNSSKEQSLYNKFYSFLPSKIFIKLLLYARTAVGFGRKCTGEKDCRKAYIHELFSFACIIYSKLN